MNSEPAFPGLHPSKECHYQDSGMRLRDYFAAKAMQGQIGNPLKLGDDEAHRRIAERAFRMADAMLKARQA
jgi:hypothetical protein